MTNTGILQDISIDYKTNKPKITLLLDTRELIPSLEELKEDKLSVEIKKYRKKRSLDANSYCWVLCDKIAKELSNMNLHLSFFSYDTFLSQQITCPLLVLQG